MDFSRIVLIALLLFFIFFSPEGQRATSDQERELRALLQQQRDALEVLNRSHFGDFSPPTGRWLNVTALRKDDAYAWEVLLLGKERARSQTNDIFEQALIDAPGKSSEGSVAAVTSFEGVDANAVDREDEVYEASGRRALPFYQNVTGIVHGRWERSRSALPQQSASNLTHLSPKVRATADHGRNITGSRGEMFVRLDERKSEVYHDGLDWVRDIKAEITVQEEGAFGDGWEMILHGVHFPDSGAIVLSTTSDKFAGIYALPHFVWSRRQFKLTQKLLNRTLSKGLQKQEKSDSIDSFPFSSPNRPADSLFPTPSCEFIAYLQQHPVQLSSSKVRLFGSLDDLEGELRTPIGAPKESVPNLRFSLVMMSPDCGFVLDSTNPSDHGAHFSHLTGVKSEVQFEQIRHLLEVFSLVVAAQIYLLIRQMKDASTPSTRSRVSYYTIAMMALGDGFVFLTFMALSLFMDAVYLTIAAFSFLSFLSVSFFGMKFLMDVWSVQAPERITSANSRRQGTVSAAQPSSASPGFNDTRQRPVGTALPRPESGSLPLPVTAANAQEIGAPPVLILPPDQDVEADAAEIEATARGPQGVNAQATTGSARREMGTMYSKFYFLLIGKNNILPAYMRPLLLTQTRTVISLTQRHKLACRLTYDVRSCASNLLSLFLVATDSAKCSSELPPCTTVGVCTGPKRSQAHPLRLLHTRS